MEAIKMPDSSAIGNLPSIYICAPVTPDEMVKAGFVNQFQAGNSDGTTRTVGAAYGPGTYSSLTLDGAKRCYRSYGNYMYECKIRGGFNGFIFFNANNPNCKAIRKYCYDVYGHIASVEEQLSKYMPKDDLNNVLRRYNNTVSSSSDFGHTQKHFYKYGIKGIVYDWQAWSSDSNNTNVHECVVPWDTTLVIPYRVSTDGGNTWRNLYNDESKLAFSHKADMKIQFYNYPTHGSEIYSDIYDSVFAWVQKKNGKYNIIEGDYEKYKPKEILPYDFDNIPTMYLNRMDDGNGGTTGGYFVGEINGIIVACCPQGYWDKFEFSWMEWSDFPAYMERMKGKEDPLYESIRKSIKKNLKEAFDEGLHNLRIPSEDEMIKGGNIRYVYRCCHENQLDSIMNNGQLRQFAGDNDGFWYGNGVYCNVELNGAIRGSKIGGYYDRDPKGWKYGNIIIKCALFGGFKDFLIFDEDLAKHYYRENYQLKDQVYAILCKDKNNVNAKAAADELWQRMEDIMRDDMPAKRYGMSAKHHFQSQCSVTTGMPHGLFPEKGNGIKDKEFYALCQEYDIRGIVYHGGNDGFSCVIYNYDECIPVAYSNDHGNSWEINKHIQQLLDRRAFDNDPIMKFGYQYKQLRYPIGYTSPFDGRKTGISVVQFKNGSWNYLDIQTGKVILPFRLDNEPSPIDSENGQFNVVYKGELLYCKPDAYWDDTIENDDGSNGSWMTWDTFKDYENNRRNTGTF